MWKFSCLQIQSDSVCFLDKKKFLWSATVTVAVRNKRNRMKDDS